MAHDVFICHSSKDRTIANAICSTLEQHHIRCWIAPRDVLPGTDYGGAITEAISTTRLTVLVFSSNSNQSTHVRREIERTISHGIPVLPFRVEEITPSPALEYFISDAHWLDAMTPPLEQHLDQLVGTVRLLLERGAAQSSQAAPPSPAQAGAPGTAAAASTPAAAAPGGAAPAPLVSGSLIAGPLPARRWPSVPVLAGIGIAAIAIVAVGAFLLIGAGRPGASQTALASASAGPSALASVVPSAGASGSVPSGGPSGQSPVPSPGDAIARITAALPTSLSCDAPETPSSGSIESATVFCYVGDGTVGSVVYTLYPTVAALRNDYGAWLDYYGLAVGTSGSCSKGEQMEDAWSFEADPSVVQGHYFCVVDDDKQANLYWTDEASLILVDLGGDTNVGLDKLYEIWRTDTYDPIRP